MKGSNKEDLVTSVPQTENINTDIEDILRHNGNSGVEKHNT